MKLWTWIRDLLRRLGGLGPRRPVCDTCRWDYGDACTRPERPNALSCPDHARR